jgi:hypothetical protein
MNAEIKFGQVRGRLGKVAECRPWNHDRSAADQTARGKIEKSVVGTFAIPKIIDMEHDRASDTEP